MLRDNVIAAIRTGVAVIVTALLAWAAKHLGVEVDDNTAVALTVFLFALAVAVYNLAVNFLAEKVHPYFGILLGIPKTPSYPSKGL